MTRDEIRSFILEELRYPGSAADLTDDYPLLEREVLDSMGIFSLVSFIESRSGIQVFDEELVPEHFASIGDIARYVDSKLATAPEA